MAAAVVVVAVVAHHPMAVAHKRGAEGQPTSTVLVGQSNHSEFREAGRPISLSI